ncbi:MAG: Ig domain-containing protein [Gemmatimonadetes bacterium]|nr:Ig domain-containing protein [Gemmatimonadota bacterium]MYB98297.1 Ig domain-containing protein [Gemmatimonadota bacterium]
MHSRSHRSLLRRSPGSWSTVSAALVTCALLACGDDPIPPEPVPVPTTVEVTPAASTLSALGETVQLTATVSDQNGNVMSGASVAWSSGDASVVTVNATGLVTATGNGTATITATSGNASGTATVTVEQAAAAITVAPDSVPLTELGETAQLTAEVTDANGNVIANATVSWSSGDEAVATVDAAGLVTAVANGSTSVTATAGGHSASAAVTVMAQPAPTEGPPTPTHAADDVISFFSGAYDDVTVDTWSADWDQADVEDVDIAGDSAKKYTNLVFAGIEFTSATVDAANMTHLRMDIWTPDETTATAFRVKLVDFGADGAFGGDDDSEHEVAITAAEGLASEAWVQLDLELTDFTNLTAREHLAQLIISGDPNTVYVDNVYLREGERPDAPTEPAPTPTDSASKVISLFSDAYDDVTVDTWSADWDVANVDDVEIAGDAVKKYTGLSYAGIEFTSAPIDATAATHFHFDLWTPDPTADPAAFKVKLVDFGADGAFGGGDDTEHEVALTANSDPALATARWVSYDLALADFANLAAREHLAQLIISGDPNTVFLDNIYFFEELTEPSEPAPTPTDPADSVISFFSDAYTDVTVDTWSADWDQADVEDVDISGNATKKYTNLVYAGIEFTSATVDATEMTHLRLDFWTPDNTADPAAFRVKLVDFGGDGAFGGGDDTEHEITLTAASDPALATGAWVSFDIALSDFTNLAAREHLAQLIISGDPNTVFLDNVYLRK